MKNKFNITKLQLEKLYLKTSLSAQQSADKIGMSRTQFGRYLDKFKIPRKTLSQVMTGRELSPEHRKKVIKTLSSSRKQTGDKNPYWKGGITTTGEGYVAIRVKNRYIKEHRYVMGQKLGRSLTENEIVHHINGDKKDNRIENLVMTTQQKHSHSHWDNEKMKKIQSRRMKKIRKNKFWSSKKLNK